MASSYLDRIKLFKDLPADRVSAVEASIHWKKINKGQELISHQADSREVYCLAEGRLRTTMFSAAGREVILRDLQPGQIFGEFAAIDGRPRAASVIAVADSIVGEMQATDFRGLLRTHPDMMERLLVDTIGLVRHMTDKVFEIAALSVKARIHIELLRRASEAATRSENQAVIAPAPSHAEFASQIGSHREAVTRELNDLSRQGILAVGRGRIDILDIAALAEVSSKSLDIGVADFFPGR